MSFYTPLRYPGGKGRLAQFVGKIVEMNGLVDGHYVEPYAGGAGIAIGLLMLEYSSHIHLNDINRSVMAFWGAVLHETEALCQLITETPMTMEEWLRQRAIQKDGDASTSALGFSTFFLNRTNRSGILSGGVIGGKEQTGDWKMDARFNKLDLIRRIRRIASYRDRIHLYNHDALAFIDDVLPGLPKRTLVYLDPPYYVKGRDLYEDHYAHEDHEKIASRVQHQVTQPWIVSYDNVEPIRELYGNRRIETFGLRYSALRRYSGSEVMIFRDGIKTPPFIRPSRASLS